MSRDYKHRIPAYRERQRRTARNWTLAVLAAVGVAGLTALGVHVFLGPAGNTASAPAETVSGTVPPPNAPAPVASQPPSNQKTPAAGKTSAEPRTARGPAAPAPVEPRFSFYKILPEKEVVLPEAEIKTRKREEILGKKPETNYLLQAGSFTSQQEAERLKTRLADLKVKARLEMIKLDSTTWYRVKLGPYASLADADRVRQHLRTNQIDSIVQKAAQ